MLIFGAVALVILLTAYLIYVLFHAEAFLKWQQQR
ncbi:K(+)-transporting ATPase subunit F [Proteus mirabilis]|nr:potassium-transporting ATPase subunit F [Proteus mirabilis]MBU9977741.1 K(+)-transporting ATPase subunit F [Proteus mirabilis]